MAQDQIWAARGLSVYRTLDGQPTGVSIKAGFGIVGGWNILNAAVAARYVKLYDKATAALATDTPLLTIGVPASGNLNVAYGGEGIMFLTGISIRVTTGVADNDVGAPTASDIIAQVLYR